MQGALFAARAIATGLGPLGFSAVFNFTTQSQHYAPSAAIWGLAVVMAMGAAVAATIRIPAPLLMEDTVKDAAAAAIKDSVGEEGDEHAQLLGGQCASPAASANGHTQGQVIYSRQSMDAAVLHPALAS